MKKVARGKPFDALSQVQRASRFAKSEAKRKILMAKLTGLNNKEIAEKLGVCSKTIQRALLAEDHGMLMARSCATHDQMFADAVGLILQTSIFDLQSAASPAARSEYRDKLISVLQRLSAMAMPPRSAAGAAANAEADGNSARVQITLDQVLRQASQYSGLPPASDPSQPGRDEHNTITISHQ